MKVEACIGEKRVLQSGTLLFPIEEHASLNVDTETGLQFTINFSFLNEKDNRDIEVKMVQKDQIAIITHGELSMSGVAPSQFVDIGTINGKNMSLYYIVYKMFEGRFLKLEYAFYEG